MIHYVSRIPSILENLLTYFWPKFPFYIHGKHQENKGFLALFGDLKWKRWPEMGYKLRKY